MLSVNEALSVMNLHHHDTTLDDITKTADDPELNINELVVQEGPDKWRCQAPECTKLFRSQSFWRKHAVNRHETLLEKLEKSIEDKQLQQNEVEDDACSCGSWQALSENEENEIEDSDLRTENLEVNTVGVTSEDYDTFTFAAAAGDVAVLEELLRRGINIEEETTKGYTALVIAILEQHIDAVKLLLEGGADPDHRVKDASPLARAAKAKKHGPEMMRLLFDSGACLKSVSGPDNHTPLHVAAMKGTAESVGFLIEQGENLEAKCQKGCTPLLLAAEAGNTETARELLSAGADINAVSKNGGNVLSWSASNDHVETMELWLAKGVEVDSRDRNGLSKFQEFH